MIRTVPLAARLLLTAAMSLSGCYKSQYETERVRASEFEKKSKDVEAELDRTRSELAAAQTRAQQLETQLSTIRSGGELTGFVDGKPLGREAIRWDGSQWLRHGDSVRNGGIVKFENGRLADQTVMMTRSRGLPWYTGAIRFGKPDGEWIWFDDAGRPHMRERWTGGRLIEVARASTAKGPLVWNKLNTRDREAWTKSIAGPLSDLPELVRETTPLPAEPAAATAQPAAPKPAR